MVTVKTLAKRFVREHILYEYVPSTEVLRITWDVYGKRSGYVTVTTLPVNKAKQLFKELREDGYTHPDNLVLKRGTTYPHLMMLSVD